MDNKNIQNIQSYLQKTVSHAHETVKIFCKKMTERPAYTLEWSNHVFKAAAVIEIHEEILEALKSENNSIERMKTYIQGRINRACSNNSTSSSPTANYMDLCRLAVWADVLETLKED